ncbi:MAG: tetratricopeptide repeat protein [Alphaproteobacteria bacterium]|jgi:tetratricopeptide (TPR) repeat protein
MSLIASRTLRASGKHEEARLLLIELAARLPHDAEVQYEAACVHDYLGQEADAVPYYLAALSGELSEKHRLSAYVGLGSTYRTLGMYADADRVLQEGLGRYPESAALKVFFAMVQYNLGHSKSAIEGLLVLLLQVSSDAEIKAYSSAIKLYAQDIERVWPQSAA